MTTNFRRDRRGGRGRRLIVLAVLSALLLGILSVNPVRHALSSGTAFLAGPIWGAAQGVRSAGGNLVAYFSSKATLRKENDRLLQALYANTNESYRAELLHRENSEFKSALLRGGDERRLALATVLARPPSTAFDTLVIDLGSADGILPGMRALSDGTFVVGEVVEVYPRAALVALYSSSGYEIDGFVGPTSTPVTFRGVGDGKFRATIPRGAEIAVGDAIALPSLHAELAGVLTGVDIVEGSSLATIHAVLPFNLHHARFIYVDLASN